MKKIKLLTGLAGLTGLSVGLVPTITSCSNSGQQITLSSTQKSREFNSKTNGVTYLFKCSDVESVSDIRVKMINLKVDSAEAQVVTGLVKTIYDSAGNFHVTIKTSVLLQQWSSASKFEFDLLFTNKENNQTTTFEGFSLTIDRSQTAELAQVPFYDCEWQVLIDRVNMLYAGTITEEQFYSSFQVYDDNDDLINVTSMNDFIGQYRTITINGISHYIYVIGVKHDNIVDAQGAVTNQAAIFTFEMSNVLSQMNAAGSAATAISSIWSEDDSLNYLNSTLRYNLNGSITKPTKGWDTTALAMISDSSSGTKIVADAIKTVQKKVGTYVENEGWTATTYNDKLFPLTTIEMNRTNETEVTSGEGTTYSYYQSISPDDPVGVKLTPTVQTTGTGKTVKSVQSYWLTSPYTDVTEDNYTFYIDGATAGYMSPLDTNSVAFAFCI